MLILFSGFNRTDDDRYGDDFEKIVFDSGERKLEASGLVPYLKALANVTFNQDLDDIVLSFASSADELDVKKIHTAYNVLEKATFRRNEHNNNLKEEVPFKEHMEKLADIDSPAITANFIRTKYDGVYEPSKFIAKKEAIVATMITDLDTDKTKFTEDESHGNRVTKTEMTWKMIHFFLQQRIYDIKVGNDEKKKYLHLMNQPDINNRKCKLQTLLEMVMEGVNKGLGEWTSSTAFGIPFMCKQDISKAEEKYGSTIATTLAYNPGTDHKPVYAMPIEFESLSKTFEVSKKTIFQFNRKMVVY